MGLESRSCVFALGAYAEKCDMELRELADGVDSSGMDVDGEDAMNSIYTEEEDRRYLLTYGIKPSDELERRFLRLYDHVDNCYEYFGVTLGKNQKKVVLLEVLCTAYNIFQSRIVEHVAFLLHFYTMEVIIEARDAVSLIVGRRGGKTVGQCTLAPAWLVTQPGKNNISFYTTSKRAANDASKQVQKRLAYYMDKHPYANLNITTHNVENVILKNRHMENASDDIGITFYPGLSNEGIIEYFFSGCGFFLKQPRVLLFLQRLQKIFYLYLQN